MPLQLQLPLELPLSVMHKTNCTGAVGTPPRSPGIPLKGLAGLAHPLNAAGVWLIAPTWEPQGSVPGSPILPGDAGMTDLVQD